jgi:GNAT superfamily N-acetyltransferase
VTAGALFTLRAGVDGDRPFVFRSWINSHRESALARSMRAYDHDHGLHGLIVELLERRGARLVVACATEAPSVILGWAVVTDPDALHYVFVKRPFRRQGIASALLGDIPTIRDGRDELRFSHMTADFAPLSRAHPRWAFNPYAAIGAPRA